jgi:hypothetical protein
MPFDLNEFLKNYKPKSYVLNAEPYLKLLPDYNFFDVKLNSDPIDKKNFITPGEYYIRYVPENQDGTNYKSHIKTGGILIGYGMRSGNSIVKINLSEPPPREQWLYLIIYRKSKDQQYYVKLNHNIIFYKKMVTADEKLATAMKSIQVKLLRNDETSISELSKDYYKR